MELIVEPAGQVRALYDETFELGWLGAVVVERASYVEPTAAGLWTADLGPVDGPVLGPFARRSEALRSELAWLRRHWLTNV
jgi:hypothetical protein